jgi:hypothetical protein
MFSKFATKLRKKGIFRAKNNLEIQETDRLNHILELNMKNSLGTKDFQAFEFHKHFIK